jgi:predicted nucleic acid-binding protein
VVVDASVAVKWLVEEIYSRQAEDLLAAWDQDNTRIAGPHLLPVEVSNALYQRVRWHQIAVDTAVQLEVEFLENDIELIQSASLHLLAMRLASDLGQPATYDTHYLALAESLDCAYWTADQRFYDAASGNYPRVRWIGEI